MERVRFIEHKGVSICFLDFSAADVEEVLKAVESARGIIRSQPPKSVLTLTYTDGARFDGNVIKAMKELARGNEPYVKAAAIAGITGLQKIILDAASLFSKREFATFDDLEKAKDYLAGHS